MVYASAEGPVNAEASPGGHCLSHSAKTRRSPQLPPVLSQTHQERGRQSLFSFFVFFFTSLFYMLLHFCIFFKALLHNKTFNTNFWETSRSADCFSAWLRCHLNWHFTGDLFVYLLFLTFCVTALGIFYRVLGLMHLDACVWVVKRNTFQILLFLSFSCSGFCLAWSRPRLGRQTGWLCTRCVSFIQGNVSCSKVQWNSVETNSFKTKICFR